MTISTLSYNLVRLSVTFIAICFISLADSAFAGNIDALYKAVGDGDSTQVSALLDGGVDVNARTGNGSFA